MVSANVRGIATQFDDMVSERDLAGFVTLAGVGAIGGVLAEMFHDRFAPMINQPANPNNAQGLGVSFLIKAAAGFTMSLMAAYLASEDMKSFSMVLAVLGVGATVDAGVDLLEAGDSLRTGMTGNSPRKMAARSTTRSQTPSKTTATRTTQSRSSSSNNPRTTRNRSNNSTTSNNGSSSPVQSGNSESLMDSFA